MSNSPTDELAKKADRTVREKVSSFPAFRKWYQSTFGKETEWESATGMQPFSIKGTTAKQEQALRGLAKEYGFEDLRGFNKFMEAAHVDYYDLIKVASP